MSKLGEANCDEVLLCRDKVTDELRSMRKYLVRGLCGGILCEKLETEYHDTILVSTIL